MLFISTKQVVSNIILSGQKPSETELALYKSKPKLIQVTVDEEKFDQAAKQFWFSLALGLLGVGVLVLILVSRSSKNDSRNDIEKKNRRSI